MKSYRRGWNFGLGVKMQLGYTYCLQHTAGGVPCGSDDSGFSRSTGSFQTGDPRLKRTGHVKKLSGNLAQRLRRVVTFR
jgi:hypothetical protein